MTLSGRRLALLRIFIIAVSVTLLARLAWLQTARGDEMAAVAERLQAQGLRVPAARGAIVDRNGAVLVGNRVGYDVEVSRAAGREELAEVSRASGVPVALLEKRRTPCGEPGAVPGMCWKGAAGGPITVIPDADPQVAFALRDADLPGVIVQESGVRDYPSTANAAAVLGYVGEAGPDDPQPAGTEVGRTGLERQYDDALRGQDGRRLTGRARTDDQGATGTELKAAEQGMSLQTTLDAGLQTVLEQALADAVSGARAQGYRAEGASAVVLDANNGEVLAMASYPTYDPRIWVGGISDKEYRRLTAPQSGKPLVLRPVQGTAPPASTFKSLTTVAAANAGFPLGGTYDCPSSVTFGGQVFRNYESRAYGPVSLAKALAVSCDSVFYRLGAKMWKRDGGLDGDPGAQEWVVRTARSFGVGSRTGIDLPGESAGSLPDRADRRADYAERKDAYCRRAREGYPEEPDPARAKLLKAYAREYCASGDQLRAGDAMNTAIGQGQTLTTPLQMAVAYAAIANGGTVVTPHLGLRLLTQDGSTAGDLAPQPRGAALADERTLKYVRKALSGTTTEGTAAGAFAGFPLDEFPVAAKTGTAEVAGQQSTSWFASFAPADDPRYVVVVNVDEGGLGAATSGPVARAAYEYLFGVDRP